MTSTPITFESVRTLSAALVVFAFAVMVAWYRRPALPVLSKVLGAIGLLLLAVAAGSPVWNRPSVSEVVVMVDLSASTRGASYRDPVALRARVATDVHAPGPWRVAGPWRYVRIENSSHWIPLDQPDRLNALLLEFLGG